MTPISSSYPTRWANSARSSRVLVRHHPVAALTRLAPVRPPNTGNFPPAFIVVAGKSLFVVHKMGTTILSAESGEVTGTNEWGGGTECGAFASDAGAFLCSKEVRADGSATNRSFPPLLQSGGQARVLCQQVTSDRLTVVTQASLHGNLPHRIMPSMTVSTARWSAEDQVARPFGGDILSDTAGVAAIFASGEIAVATHRRNLIVYAGDQLKSGMTLARQLDTHIAFSPYDVSVGANHMAFLSADNYHSPDSDSPGDEDSDLAQRRIQQLQDDTEKAPSWTSTLHVLDRRGVEHAKQRVPFAVLEPPIDGGAERFWLAGFGLALVDHGHLMFARPATQLYRATAFESGELAVAVGGELQILNASGTILQSFRVGQGETITTPPAIDASGAIWLATEKNVYVAR